MPIGDAFTDLRKSRLPAVCIRGSVWAAVLAVALSTQAALGQSAQSNMKNGGSNTPQGAQPPEVVKSRVIYQQQVIAPCNGGLCQAGFLTLPEKTRLEIQFVACAIDVTGGVLTQAFLDTSVSSIVYTLPLRADPPIKNGAHLFYTFGQPTGFFVQPNHGLGVFMHYTGTTSAAFCDIFGQMVTLG
jgi:hypothetical protein